VADSSIPHHVRPAPGLVLRATAGARPLFESEDRALRRALDHCAVRLAPLFGQSQFCPDRRVAGPDWTTPAAPELLSPYYCVRSRDAIPQEELFARWQDVASTLTEVGAVDAVFPTPPTDLPVRSPGELGLPARNAAAEAPTPTQDFRARQAYLDASGVNALAARDVDGATGTGVRIADIEGGWCWEHEDLLRNIGGVIAGRPLEHDLRTRNHGTAVLGIMGADVNPFGTTGICPGSVLSGCSVYGQAGGAAAAIRIAADALAPGDILLVELHLPGPRWNFADREDQSGYVAVEFFPEMFAAIRYATARGVIVVEAAGNGGQHLADAVHNARPEFFPADWRNPFDVDAGSDSGAVLVGAGAPAGWAPQPADTRLAFSNWGRRVDSYGWGAGVATTGGFWTGEGDLAGGPDETRWYTKSFSGTSSASPMVAGALACMQGARRAAGYRPLTPDEARRALRETGSKQVDTPAHPAAEYIGRRPDVRALVDWAMAEIPPTDDQRRNPMRVQIIIDDSDGAGDNTVSVRRGEQARPEDNGSGPRWRGPFYLVSGEEASRLGVPVGQATTSTAYSGG
jgi:Subtilase family